MYGVARLRRCLEVLQREGDLHAELVGQPRADEVLVALPADARDQKTEHVVAEVVVLKVRANILAQLEMPHRREQLGRLAIAGKVHPIVARQARPVTEQVEHSHPLGRNRVGQAKFRNVVAHRFRPVEPPFVLQERHGGCGEGLGDRADEELRGGRHRQLRLDVALAIGFQQHELAVVHDGKRRAGDLPVGHGAGRNGIDVSDEVGDRRGMRHRWSSHGMRSFALERKKRARKAGEMRACGQPSRGETLTATSRLKVEET